MANGPESGGQSQPLGYVRALLRRKWTVIIVTVLAAGAALGLSEIQTPVYQASSKILLQQSSTQQDAGGGVSINYSTVNVSDEITVLGSPAVQALVRQRLGTVPPISGDTVSGTDVMTVTANSTVPSRAAVIANAYANAYLQSIQGQAAGTLASSAQTLQAKINTLQAQITALNAQVSRASPEQRPTVQATVTPQVSAISQQIATLQQQISSFQSGASSGQSGGQIVALATTPTSPASPQKVRNGLLGLAGGLVLGIGLAFVREAMDDTITTREDIDRAQPGLPVLGIIPAVSSSRQRHGLEVVSTVRPHSAAAEAYRSLRTSIQFLGLDRPLRTLQVTSTRTSEGKTTTLANLGVALAGAGQRVIMVSCDLRRPLLHDFFGLSNDEGFTSVLLGGTHLSAALQDVPNLGGLQVLASGPKPPNPSELLSTPPAAELISTLCERADLVLVDSPPALAVTDAVVLAPRLDATVVVVSSGHTTRRDLDRALELLGQVDAPVVGAVLNSDSTEATFGYRSGYAYGVPSPDEAAPQTGRP